MAIRDKLRKAAGLFVELQDEPEPVPTAAPTASDDDLDKRLAAMDATLKGMGAPASPPPATPPARTVEDIVREAEGPNLEDIKAPQAPVLTAEGKIDFAALYAQAGIPGTGFTAEQTLDMLASLPAELPLETKRQTVKVTLGAMGKSLGATPETIVADASRKLAALASYTDGVARQTADFVASTELEIAALQAQIADKRAAIDSARQHQTQVARTCESESDRLDDVLEFFSLDIPPSRLAPPTSGQ